MNKPDLITLYRPTGLDELGLIYDLGLRGFPARLAGQPIFYPVTTPTYAIAIARQWNVKGSNAAGYVTRFSVDATYARTFERHIVGGREHEELWVPAEQLGEFNAHIVGRIELMAAFFGPGFVGVVPDAFMLKGRSATDQLLLLSTLLHDYRMDFHLELRANQKPVWMNYSYWTLPPDEEHVLPSGRRHEVIEAIRADWPGDAPPLPALDDGRRLATP